MKKILSFVIIISIFSINSFSSSAELVKSKINQSINSFNNKISANVTSFAEENFDSLKYLDFEIKTQENLKPTFSIMSVTEIFKIYSDTGTIFNQTSLNMHDDDETINVGFGMRKLLNDNKILVGSSIFYDHQFDKQHKRAGAGIEAISSVFDIRGNYYNAISRTKSTKDGTERALDGWDTQLDYHLPGEYDVNIFANMFKFENPDKVSTYEEKGYKYGTNAKLGNFIFEGGYLDDNKKNDGYFGSIKFAVKLGTYKKKEKRTFLEYTDVSHKLYQPVKRENKIRVVKISKSGVKVGGF
jgi:hypothetical protein